MLQPAPNVAPGEPAGMSPCGAAPCQQAPTSPAVNLSGHFAGKYILWGIRP